MKKRGRNLSRHLLRAGTNGDNLVQVDAVQLVASDLCEAGMVPIGASATIRMTYTVKRLCDNEFVPNFHIRTLDGLMVCVVSPPNWQVKRMAPSQFVAECVIS